MKKLAKKTKLQLDRETLRRLRHQIRVLALEDPLLRRMAHLEGAPLDHGCGDHLEIADGDEVADFQLALADDRPLAFFAGICVRGWTSVRKVKEGETTNDLFAFLTTEPNALVGTYHPKAMPAWAANGMGRTSRTCIATSAA